jgi:hypothetical protein
MQLGTLLLSAVAIAAMSGAVLADLLVVSPSQFSGTRASFSDNQIGGNPPPYGFTNNATDNGWIWNVGDYFTVDFLTPTALEEFRVWSVYARAPDPAVRGARWEILSSDDGFSFTHEANFNYLLSRGGGVNNDGTVRSDSAGWYEGDLNPTNAPFHRYWRIRDSATLAGHSPRSAQVEFYGITSVPEPSVVLLACGALAVFGFARRLRYTTLAKSA